MSYLQVYKYLFSNVWSTLKPTCICVWGCAWTFLENNFLILEFPLTAFLSEIYLLLTIGLSPPIIKVYL